MSAQYNNDNNSDSNIIYFSVLITDSRQVKHHN